MGAAPVGRQGCSPKLVQSGPAQGVQAPPLHQGCRVHPSCSLSHPECPHARSQSPALCEGTHTRTHTRTHTLTHIRSHAHTRTFTHAHTHAHTCSHTCTHALMLIHARSHTLTLAQLDSRDRRQEGVGKETEACAVWLLMGVRP